MYPRKSHSSEKDGRAAMQRSATRNPIPSLVAWNISDICSIWAFDSNRLLTTIDQRNEQKGAASTAAIVTHQGQVGRLRASLLVKGLGEKIAASITIARSPKCGGTINSNTGDGSDMSAFVSSSGEAMLMFLPDAVRIAIPTNTVITEIAAYVKVAASVVRTIDHILGLVAFAEL